MTSLAWQIEEHHSRVLRDKSALFIFYEIHRVISVLKTMSILHLKSVAL